MQLLLKYKARVTADDIKYIDRGLFYPHNKFSENPPDFSHFSHFSHPTIMALLYLTRFENACANLQENEKSDIAPYVFLLDAKRFDPTFVEEYLGLLQSTSPGHPFQGIQENLKSSTVNEIIDTKEFKQLSKNISQSRFIKICGSLIFAIICYLLIKAYKPELGLALGLGIMIIGLLPPAPLKEKKAHLHFAFDKLPPEEYKAYPLKNANLFPFSNREDKIDNLTDRKNSIPKNSSSFIK